MSTYYPIRTEYRLRDIGSSAMADLSTWRVIRPEPRVASDRTLCDVVGVDKDWVPRTDRPSVDQDPPRAILGERTDINRMTVGALVYQILQRERIKEQSLSQLLYEECKIDSQMMRLSTMDPSYVGTDIGRLQNTLSAELTRLEMQKRAEEVECWRDTSRLKGQLLEIFAQYRDVARRYEMVVKGMLTGGVTEPV